MSSKSLWGDLSQIERVRSPRTILLEQAQYLTEVTKGALVGSVSDEIYPGRFRYYLVVEVPVLNSYRVTVLTAEHDVDLYPVRIKADRAKIDVTCHGETEFENVVGSVLSSPAIKTMLSRLLSQLT
jgi:hypothetical protein